MIITCDAYCNMGYIYVQPPKENLKKLLCDKDNKISQYVDEQSLHIPLEIESEKSNFLEGMSLSEKTYKQALGTEVDAEYCNDLDKDGYLIGIELNLTKDRLINLVVNRAFKIYKTKWQGLSFYISTYDYENKVFDSNNVIYPLSKKRDAFIIIEITGPYKVGLVKALITANDDVYPIDYLLDPQFILSEYTL
ncbi:hypothetical protein [Brevibacillus sp. NRS-1366]|uniref:hypothetical protein n=1 Tax=Brevibacillus sp. NRS-1366 TaxID=3233899 RepID=UPI003D1C8C33